jgi:hypothetical protein
MDGRVAHGNNGATDYGSRWDGPIPMVGKAVQWGVIGVRLA